MQIHPAATNELPERRRLRQPELPAEAQQRVGDGVGAQQEHHADAAAEVEEVGDLVGRGLYDESG
jgi:hypothetical protein